MILIPVKYHHLFPIRISNMRVELQEGVDQAMYVHPDCLTWRMFLDAFDKDPARKMELMPLYNYVLNSKSVDVELKQQIIDNL